MRAAAPVILALTMGGQVYDRIHSHNGHYNQAISGSTGVSMPSFALTGAVLRRPLHASSEQRVLRRGRAGSTPAVSGSAGAAGADFDEPNEDDYVPVDVEVVGVDGDGGDTARGKTASAKEKRRRRVEAWIDKSDEQARRKRQQAAKMPLSVVENDDGTYYVRERRSFENWPIK